MAARGQVKLSTIVPNGLQWLQPRVLGLLGTLVSHTAKWAVEAAGDLPIAPGTKVTSVPMWLMKLRKDSISYWPDGLFGHPPVQGRGHGTQQH